MKVNELRVGDWIQDVDEHHTYLIVGIKYDVRYLDKEPIITVMDGNGHWFEKTLDEIRPKPLTDEILKTIGFERDGGASYWHKGGHCASILHWNKDKMELMIGSPGDDCFIKKPVRYVHELQNAFRVADINEKIELKTGDNSYSCNFETKYSKHNLKIVNGDYPCCDCSYFYDGKIDSYPFVPNKERPHPPCCMNKNRCLEDKSKCYVHDNL